MGNALQLGTSSLPEAGTADMDDGVSPILSTRLDSKAERSKKHNIVFNTYKPINIVNKYTIDIARG